MQLNFRKTRQVGRKVVLLVLFIFITFLVQKIALGLLDRAKTQPAETENTRGETSEKQFVGAEYSGTRKSLVIKADNFYLDEQQNQHLEGQVEVIDESVDGKVILKADKLVVTPDRKKITAEEGVEVELSNLRIKAAKLEYLVDDKTAKAAEAKLFGDNMNIFAQNLRYAVQSKMAMFEGNFEGKNNAQETSFYFYGRNAIWEKDAGLLQAEELTVRSGQVEAYGKKALVYFKKETGDFDSIKLESSCSILGRAAGKGADFQEIKIFSEKADIMRADERINILADGTFQMEGKGQEMIMNGTGENLNLVFKSEEGLERMMAKDGHLKFINNNRDEKELSGERIEYEVTSGNVSIKGQANGAFKDFDISSKELRFKISDQSFFALDYKMMIKPSFFQAKTIMFSQKKGAYVTGDSISGSANQIGSSGRVRIWQDDSLLTASKVTIDRKTSNLALEEEVSLNCSVKAGEGKQKKISLTAARVFISSEERKIQADGHCVMNLDDLKLNVPKIKISLDQEDSEKLMSIELLGALEISWKKYLARGKRAFYQGEKEKLEVSGSPELITQEGNRVEADKLTLYLADDRILIENRKRERSQVILVGEK